jgi:hypothetical protein
MDTNGAMFCYAGTVGTLIINGSTGFMVKKGLMCGHKRSESVPRGSASDSEATSFKSKRYQEHGLCDGFAV